MTDIQIRLFAFDWLIQQTEIHGEFLPWKILFEGFSLSGNRYGLVGPKGIWKPKGMILPISIMSKYDSKYSDSIALNNQIINYNYRDLDPYHRDNLELKELLKLNIPLIYFLGTSKNSYAPIWPVYIIKDNPSEFSVSVMADDMAYIQKEPQSIASNELPAIYARRGYITATKLVRTHQNHFREIVLKAYRNQCALCRLRHPELLDAAHIIGDKEDNGEPIIQNGLSLCKIHHSAFDKNILGISPDFIVKIRKDILEEIDGPMLKYGLQSLDSATLILPRNLKDYPDKERLDFRFNQFLKAG